MNSFVSKKAKMLSKRSKWILVSIVVLFTLVVLCNKEYFIQEHLSNPPPTLDSLANEVEETKAKLETVTSEFEKMKRQADAQASAATAATAALNAIN